MTKRGSTNRRAKTHLRKRVRSIGARRKLLLDAAADEPLRIGFKLFQPSHKDSSRGLIDRSRERQVTVDAFAPTLNVKLTDGNCLRQAIDKGAGKSHAHRLKIGFSGDPRDRAEAVGAKPGLRLPQNDADAILQIIASETVDLFLTVENAKTYLQAKNFAGSGKNALELIKAGGTATVLGRLDELRFGSQG